MVCLLAYLILQPFSKCQVNYLHKGEKAGNCHFSQLKALLLASLTFLDAEYCALVLLEMAFLGLMSLFLFRIAS